MSILEKISDQPPVVVGCVDGSASQMVAMILRERGCYMGKKLSPVLDNMDFANCLGGRWPWTKQHFPFDSIDDSVRDDVNLFRKVYLDEKLSLREKARVSMIKMEHLNMASVAVASARALMQKTESIPGMTQRSNTGELEDTEGCLKWGFKFPSSILFLKPMLEVFPDMKFIHLVRDGRDIVLSGAAGLLVHYAELFGLPKEGNVENLVEVWSRMNQYVVDVCREHMPESNYFLLNLEKLCQEPRTEIGRMLKFVGLTIPQGNHLVYHYVKAPATTGRWGEDEYVFQNIDDSVLKQFGYEVTEWEDDEDETGEPEPVQDVEEVPPVDVDGQVESRRKS